MSRHCASVIRSVGLPVGGFALLFTRMSRCPKRATVSSTSWSASADCVRSPVRRSVSRPTAAAIAPMRLAAASSRSCSASVAPSRANSSVIAGPMNSLTFVTSATFPVSFMIRMPSWRTA